MGGSEGGLRQLFIAVEAAGRARVETLVLDMTERRNMHLTEGKKREEEGRRR